MYLLIVKPGVLYLPRVHSRRQVNDDMSREPEGSNRNMAPYEDRRHDPVWICCYGQYLLLIMSRDRATYDSSSTTAVTYTVASPGDAPETLTYGPSFISLAASYAGEVIIGLNRRLDDIINTISAAILAQDKMDNLYSIELGNEPNCGFQMTPP
jgi:hypothetical protein